jgi:hypothetical protein
MLISRSGAWLRSLPEKGARGGHFCLQPLPILFLRQDRTSGGAQVVRPIGVHLGWVLRGSKFPNLSCLGPSLVDLGVHLCPNLVG